jgi:hypothetical protein
MLLPLLDFFDNMRPSLPVWTRLAPSRWADTWGERLAWAGRDRIVCTAFPGRKTVRLQVFCQKEGDAAKLPSCSEAGWPTWRRMRSRPRPGRFG